MKPFLKIQIKLLLYSFFCFNLEAQIYKAVYEIKFAPNLLNLSAIRTEKALLMIDFNKNSKFATENFIKQDSIKKLISEGKVSFEIMTDNKKYKGTSFRHYIFKNYDSQIINSTNIVASSLNAYNYTQKNEIIWELHTDTLKVNNYVCNKATTFYEGRNYTAWYTQEIPISDGPYKFWGLPGLILEIYDAENHYHFSLVSFEKVQEKPFEMYFEGRKVYDISYEKFRQLSKDASEDPTKVFEIERNSKIEKSHPVTNKRNFIGRFN